MRPPAISAPLAVVVAALLLAAGCGSRRLTMAELEDPNWVPSTTTTFAPTVGSLRSAPTTTVVPPPPSSGAGTAITTAGGWTAVASNVVSTGAQCGDVTLVSAQPTSDMVIAGVAHAGLWGQRNGASTWSKLGQGSGSASITNKPSSIVYDPDHPATFWESGIYFGNGVYRTDDNGATFKELGNIDHIDAVSVDLTDPARQTLLAGRHEGTPLWRSTDGGNTWTDISKNLPPDAGYPAGPTVLNTQNFLVGTKQGSSAGIYRTTDGGNTWTKVFAGPVEGVAVINQATQTMFWVIDSGGVIKSKDAGVTWALAARPGSVNAQASTLLELPDGSLAALGNQYVLHSADEGSTWQRVSPPLPAPGAGLAYSAARKAFFVWSITCAGNPGDPIKPESILTLNTAA
jgi:photosystem II stability/assembly factor-like uncharacterized protein